MTSWPDGSKTKPYVSSGFGPRKAPIAGASTYHRGTDFSHTFDLIRAVDPGVVVAIDVWPALGHSVWIQHDGYFSKSGHMKNKPPVSVGETVSEGRIVGIVGQTGTATDDHLHFEITPGRFHTANTGQVDPVPFITARLAQSAGNASKPPATSLPRIEIDMKVIKVIQPSGTTWGLIGTRFFQRTNDANQAARWEKLWGTAVVVDNATFDEAINIGGLWPDFIKR